MKILPLIGATLLGVSPFSVNAEEFKQVSKFETYKNYREQAGQDGDIIVFDQKSAPEIVDATEDENSYSMTTETLNGNTKQELHTIYKDDENPTINWGCTVRCIPLFGECR